MIVSLIFVNVKAMILATFVENFISEIKIYTLRWTLLGTLGSNLLTFLTYLFFNYDKS